MAQERVRRTEAEPDLSGRLMQRGTMIRFATYEFISNAIRKGSLSKVDKEAQKRKIN